MGYVGNTSPTTAIRGHIHLVASEVIILVKGRHLLPEHTLTQCCKRPVAEVLRVGGKVTKYHDICTCGPLRKETASMKEKN